MGSPRFRAYESDDFNAMFRLDEICFAPQFRFSRRDMRHFAEASNARVVIADAHPGIAGFCVLHLEPVRGGCVGYVVTLDIAPEWRRRGLATELMHWAEAQAAADGCASMALHVFSANDAAVRFYERIGYTLETRAAGFYGRDASGKQVDAFVYRKRLAQDLPVEANGPPSAASR